MPRKTPSGPTASRPADEGAASERSAQESSEQVESLAGREARPSKRRKRQNRRSGATIARILAATEQIVLESGAVQVSILDVCRASRISRGTFYRYFSSREELLDAFSRHERERFHQALAAATRPFDEPNERFEAMIGFLETYARQDQGRRLLLAAPEYALGFFQRIFNDSIVRFEDLLCSVFDAWDARWGVRIDREMICEMLVRYVLSQQLIANPAERQSLPRRAARFMSVMMEVDGR